MKLLAVPAYVTIVTPCLNEARTIAACVTRALELISTRFKLSGEVVVADNGSHDWQPRGIPSSAVADGGLTSPGRPALSGVALRVRPVIGSMVLGNFTCSEPSRLR